MVFPDGFTGFRREEEFPIPSIDLAVFKSVCHAAARIVRGKVVAFEIAQVTPNFHCAIFEWGHEPAQVSVLCNRAFYIVGFCRPKPRHICANEYVDAAELASALGQVSDWQILSKAELETVVDDSAVQSMSEPDRRMIENARRKGWFGPSCTVGDLLFHYSD